jgi:hypothetical protein
MRDNSVAMAVRRPDSRGWARQAKRRNALRGAWLVWLPLDLIDEPKLMKKNDK